MGKMFTVLRAMEEFTTGESEPAQPAQPQGNGQLAVGECVVRVSGALGEGTIVKVIPAHMDKYPVRRVEAKAVVAWPAPRRIGGNGYMHTTVALSSLARPDEVGICDQCGRRRRLITTGTEAYPVRRCGTCLHRQERRINTKEMYGHGRRGY